MSSRAKQSSLYLQDEWKIFNSLELSLGVRGTHYDKTASNYIEPRASFVFKLPKNVNLKGAWGKYNQFVSRITNEDVLDGSRDFWLLADDELKPGFAEHYILGLNWENNEYLFEVEGYYKDLKNLIEYTWRYGRRRDINNPFFTGTGYSKGIDFLLQKKRGALTGWLGYTLGKVEYDFPDLNNGVPFPADHDRRNEFKFVGNYTKGSWSFSATWVYATGKAYTSPESQYYLTMLDGAQTGYIHVSDKNANRFPAYHRLDFSFSRRVTYQNTYLDYGISVFNLYNRKNVRYKEYNLDISPIVITDMLMLGFTPTIYVRLQLK